MKAIRLIFTATLLLSLLFTACETENTPVVDEPAQEENTDDGTENENDEDKGNENEEGKEDEESKEDNSWMENPQPLPEATYALNERIAVSDYVKYEGGKRNDYISFFEESTDRTLFLDIYTDESNTLLPTGRYLLADNFDNAVYREWSYLTLYTGTDDLLRFTEGWAEVIADAEHSSGYPYHKIRAYFVMESGESVSLEFEGTISETQVM